MKYNQKFLKSLAGLTVDEAKGLCKNLGRETLEYPNGSILPMIARSEIILFTNQDGTIVIKATAGDPCQLEDDK